MRPLPIVLMAALAGSACSFEIEPVVFPPGVLPEGGVAADLTPPVDLAGVTADLVGDLAGDLALDLTMNPDTGGLPPDLTGPDQAMPPDMTKVPQLLFAIDGRSPNVYRALAQPLLPSYQAQTVAHYLFDEAQLNDTLVDSSGAGNNLSAVTGMFNGIREQFTHIPAANGSGFKRLATEFKSTGFVAGNGAALDIDQEDFTIEAWFKIPPGYVAMSNAPACDPIVSKGSSPGYQVCVTDTGKLRMRVAWGGGMMTKQIETMASFSDGAWHLGTFVFGTKVKDTGAIFIDGANLTPGKNDLLIGGSIKSAAKAFVGGESGKGDNAYFAGSLAEVVLHKGKLVSLKEHQGEYVAFGMPLGAGAPSPGTRLSTSCANNII